MKTKGINAMQKSTPSVKLAKTLISLNTISIHPTNKKKKNKIGEQQTHSA